MPNSKWFLEQISAHEGSFYSLEEIIFNKKSSFQNIEIIRSGAFGKCLILDGKMQSSESDEFIYHEAIIHPAMVCHNHPERVCIAGGGEGATAREILKYSSVKEIILLDIDEDVIASCKKHLPEWHQGAFDDRRVKIYYEDARTFIERSSDFDIIIIDLPEPMENGSALMLYTKEFYSSVFNALTKDGIAVTQAAATAPHNLMTFTAIVNTLSMVFPIVRPYTVNIPSFFTPWGFVLASKREDPATLSSQQIDKKIFDIQKTLRFYDSEAHKHMFSLPKYLRSAITNQNTVITDNQPLSFYQF
ncbi:MAG: polyamine aminopropyltransferase [Thermodesulfovibrionales bacterium]|nr:polyamine aminopropyltransferase [Thermodesulfovibrionales bacterium]